MVAGSNVTITPDATNDAVTIAAKDTTYSDVTTSAHGLMSAADKTKLDTIATGANKTVVDSALSSTSTNPVQNNIVNSALAEKVPSTRTVNGKTLAANISLTADDVGASAAGHTHDDRYYTESEINSKLAGKANSSHKHAAADITSVNASAITGTIAAANLPSFVDDVIEGYYNASDSKFYENYDASAKTYSDAYTGETGKIYVDLNDDKTYRWSGSKYVVVSETIALGETSSTAYRGDRGKAAYDHSQKTGNPHGTTKADLGLGNVENKSSATIRGELTKANVTTALGYTPPTTNTTYSTGSTTYSGTTKLYTNTGTNTDGTMTQNAITTALNGKANNHSHPYLPTAGGTMSGNITFADIGDKAKAAGLSWKGSTDSASIYYETRAADEGHLVLNMFDDSNVTVDIAAGGAVKSYFDYGGKFHGNVAGNATTASSANSVPWSGVTGKPSSMPASDVYSWAKQSRKPSYSVSVNVDSNGNATFSVS